MKTITIRMSSVEEAMLVEVKKRNKEYRDLQSLLAGLIQKEYEKLAKGRSALSR